VAGPFNFSKTLSGKSLSFAFAQSIKAGSLILYDAAGSRPGGSD
jgi:hypothetical protein